MKKIIAVAIFAAVTMGIVTMAAPDAHARYCYKTQGGSIRCR